MSRPTEKHQSGRPLKRSLVVRIVLLVMVVSNPASAQLPSGTVHHPMPEPLIAETVTDIDGDSKGELEFDVTSTFARSRQTGADGVTIQAETEWRATRRLGLSLEVDADRARTSGESPREANFSGSLAASWILLHDFARDMHLQLEVGARIGAGEKDDSLAPGALELPYSTVLRFGRRWDRWTLRFGAGVSFGNGTSLVGALALFRETVSKAGRQSYYGIEINANTSRRRPLEMDPEVVFTFPIGPTPPHFGAAILWSPDHAGSGSSVGALLRLIVEIDRD